MSTTHHQVVGKCSSSEACEFTSEIFRWSGFRGRRSRVFVSAGAGIDLRKLSEEVHRSVAGARFALQTVEKLTGAEHFWKMKSAKCSPHFSESSISHKKNRKNLSRSAQPRICVEESPLAALRERWSIWCDAPAMRVCNRLWQKIGTAARRKASVMLQRSWQAGLQLEVAKHSVMASQLVLDHSATLVLCGIAAGGC